MSATVRFSQLVSECGKPRLHVLWGPPERDGEFQRALKTHRVLTIRQENVGSRKDYGVVGFFHDRPAQYLVFPRSLKAFQGGRVVGIKYDLFDPPAPARPSAEKAINTRKPPLAQTLPGVEKEKSGRKTEKEERPSSTSRAVSKTDVEWDRPTVLKELRSALKELEAGKAVVVYRRLEQLVSRLSD